MAKKQERVIQSRIGVLTIPQDRVIHFPRGLIGFEQEREFTLVQVREDSPFLILQSMNDPRLGLLVADPYGFISEYDVVVGEAERKILRIENIRQVMVLVTVTIPQGRPQDTTLNLTGPVIINMQSRIGLQVPQTDAKYPSRYCPGEHAAPASEQGPPESGEEETAP
ncbi:flagellar assembly protein FliW [Fundidesulfovibrio soli]|uniref:flagellar assembly protein FliW n=1 Tax=Fundidesulfovibrio soli TaxID=2922716 RepID=UPI001FAF1BCF|nr:flagellar assembly protein FliW [Fundidesulfovibrio soli]